MSEKKLESKPSRTSILKPRKSINQSTANESNPDITSFKDPRRVSFANINSVKPFVHDPEKNTIWDNTYEEEVNHTDSTKSNDHIETKENLDMSSACHLTLKYEEEINISLLVPEILESNNSNKSLNINVQQCDKENYVPNIVNNPFLTQDSVKFSDSVFNNTSMQLTDLEDMELTGVASKSEPTRIKDSRMQFSYVSENKKRNASGLEMSIRRSKEKNKNVIQDMQLTCVSSEDKSANDTNQDIESMQMTCVNDLDASMQLTSVNPVAVSRTVQDMQLTCVFPTENVEHDPKNVAQVVETSMMQLTCDYSKDRNVNGLQDMQLTCVSSMANKSFANITDQVGETMEFTCIGPQSDTVASNNIKDLSPTGTRSIQSKTIIFDESDMQLTDVIAKEIIINKVHTSLHSDTKLQTSKAVMFEETNMNITSAVRIEEDMEFTCVFNDINKHNPVLRNEKSVSAESSSSTNRLVKNVNFSESFKDQNILSNISSSNLQKSRSSKPVPETSLGSKVDENSVLFKETNMNKTSAMDIEEDMEFTCAFNDVNKHNPVLRNEKSVSAESSCSSLKNQHISTNISNSSLHIHDKTQITEKNVTEKITNTSKQLSRNNKPVPETLLEAKVDPKSVILDIVESFKTDKEFSIVEYCNGKRKENLNTFLSSSTEKKFNENLTCSINRPPLLKERTTESNNSTVKHTDKNNLVHSTNDSCTEGESLDLKNTLEETSDKVEPHFSFAIYRGSTLGKKGDKKELDEVELDAGITTEHEHEQVLGIQNYKLTPEALSIDYTPSTSFAMIINNSRFVEHSGKKVNSTKSPLFTSKRDDELEGHTEEDAKSFGSDNNSEINAENNDLILSDSSEHVFTNRVNNGSMLDTSNIPLDFLVQDEETEKAVLIPTNRSDIKSETNSLNFTSSGLNSSENPPRRLFQYVQEELLNLPKVEVPKFSEDLLKVFKKLEEAQQRVAHRLENLKFPEIELTDLEELDKLEDDLDISNTSRFSDVVSANSGDDNIEEETGLLDIEVPKSLEERVKEAALRSEKYWEFAKSDADYYCFYTFSRAVPFKVRVRPDSGLVDEIQTYPNLQEDAAPYLYYISKYLQEKLKYKSLLLVLGDKFDLLALLDYVCICMEEVLIFFGEFNKLVEEYGRTHKFRMESDFTVVVEVLNTEYAIWWTISIGMSITNLGQPGHVKATHTIEEVDEKRIQSLMENTTGPSYLRDFIIRLDRYVQQEGKRIAARREDEFQRKFESNWTFK